MVARWEAPREAGSPAPAQYEPSPRAWMRRTGLPPEQQSPKGRWWGHHRLKGTEGCLSQQNLLLGSDWKGNVFLSPETILFHIQSSLLAGGSCLPRSPPLPASTRFIPRELPLAQIGASNSRRGTKSPKGFDPPEWKKGGLSLPEASLPNPFLRRLRGTAEGSSCLPYGHETFKVTKPRCHPQAAESSHGARPCPPSLALELVGGPWCNLGGSETRPLSKPILFPILPSQLPALPGKALAPWKQWSWALGCSPALSSTRSLLCSV